MPASELLDQRVDYDLVYPEPENESPYSRGLTLMNGRSCSG